MKTNLAETKFEFAVGLASRLFSRITCLGAVILICTTAAAQNLFVSGYPHGQGDRSSDVCAGAIFEFTWDGFQSIFAYPCNPSDVAFNNAGNLYVVNWEIVGPHGQISILKYTPNGVSTTFASGLSYPLYLAADTVGDLFVADYTNGNGNTHPGSIYKYAPDGSRVTFAVLDPSDQPADLAFDSTGNLFMADLGGSIYVYSLGVLRRHPRTIFGSVPNSAHSLAFDSAGNLFVLDAGDVYGNGNAIYKFSTQGIRRPFVSGHTLGETFAYLAFQPLSCCQ